MNIEGLEERGESFYNPYLNDVVSELEGMGLAVESEGAKAVFLDGVSFKHVNILQCALFYFVKNNNVHELSQKQ